MDTTAEIVSGYASIISYVESIREAYENVNGKPRKVNILGGQVAQLAEYLLYFELLKRGVDTPRTHNTKILTRACRENGITPPRQVSIAAED